MLKRELDRIVEAAWLSYSDYHKSPPRAKSRPGFADPNFDVPIEWLPARAESRPLRSAHKNPKSPSRS